MSNGYETLEVGDIIWYYIPDSKTVPYYGYKVIDENNNDKVRISYYYDRAGGVRPESNQSKMGWYPRAEFNGEHFKIEKHYKEYVYDPNQQKDEDEDI